MRPFTEFGKKMLTFNRTMKKLEAEITKKKQNKNKENKTSKKTKK